MAKKKAKATKVKAVAGKSKKRAYVSQEDVPGNSLEDALNIARELINNYASKPATPLQVASALNVAPTSGSFRHLCGSSIAYGLTIGGYNAKEISITPLAKRILTPTEEGDDLIAKREAALKPRILGEFIRKYEASPLPKHEIALNVLAEMGVPRDRTESVYSLILDTAETVGLIREIKNKRYIDLSEVHVATKLDDASKNFGDTELSQENCNTDNSEPVTQKKELGQGIFVAHGKNKKPLEQLKKILDQFKIPYRVATEEPNLGRPIGTKVKEIMESCNCAILLFTADEEFHSKDGHSTWRPSENVIYELGASGYLYGSRIVILKEDGVEFPTNFRDLGYISFSKDHLEAKSMDVLKELIGFGIVKVST